MRNNEAAAKHHRLIYLLSVAHRRLQRWMAAQPQSKVTPAQAGVPKQTPTGMALPMPWIIALRLPIPIRKMAMATALVTGAIPILRAPMCAFQDNSLPSAVAP